MALEALTAKANTGSGTDQLAVIDTASGKAAAVALVDAVGVLVDGANPLPVEIQGGLGTVELGASSLAALENVQIDSLPLASGAASEETLGTVTELLREVSYRLSDIADSVGNLMPDTAGRIRVAAETLGTLSTITTVTTVSTVTNQAQMGGMALNAYLSHVTQMSEGDLRRNVVIS